MYYCTPPSPNLPLGPPTLPPPTPPTGSSDHGTGSSKSITVPHTASILSGPGHIICDAHSSQSATLPCAAGLLNQLQQALCAALSWISQSGYLIRQGRGTPFTILIPILADPGLCHTQHPLQDLGCMWYSPQSSWSGHLGQLMSQTGENEHCVWPSSRLVRAGTVGTRARMHSGGF